MSDQSSESTSTSAPTLEKGPTSAWTQSTSAAAYHPPAAGSDRRTNGRFWSTRRIPAAVVALLLLFGTGLLLYDLVAVRAGATAMSWRRTLAKELATRPLDDVWLLTGAVLVAVAGLWLLVLALTPGSRGLLTMRTASPEVRTGLESAAAALVLRDRAMQVAGVRTVRVTVGRRRVKARAEAHFRELDEVRADLDSALGEGIRQLGLAHQPRLSVHLRRARRR